MRIQVRADGKLPRTSACGRDQVSCEHAGELELAVQRHVHDAVGPGYLRDLEGLFVAGVAFEDKVSCVGR
ncbi:MAG: hypothetical protein H5T95_04470 [Firmicutes bacterium]|nr:hypothetical protein [Bacillota bacterium]